MITELWQLGDIDGPGIGVIGDFYARVTINGVTQDNEGACEEARATGLIIPFPVFKNFERIEQCGGRTPWVFTRLVPAGQSVHVKIQIFDKDLIIHDEADPDPREDDSAIDLDIDPATGQWSGDLVWPQTCTRPDLRGGGGKEDVNVCFQASFDSDEDGLLDVWELFGVDTDNDALIDVDLQAIGTHPLHKDVLLEADYLRSADHSHGPLEDAIQRIVVAFANAPVPNLDGSSGVQLHVDVGPLFGAGIFKTIAGTNGVRGTFGDHGGGNAIPEAGHEIIDAFRGGDDSVDPFELKKAFFNPLRENFFRYALFGHQTNARAAVNDCTSGVAHTDHRIFLVTLGGQRSPGTPCWGAVGGISVGSSEEQSGAFMHELGHTLGLEHGGADSVNDKPNYLSAMNYAFWDCRTPASPGLLPGGCDYSRAVNGVLPLTLDEENLDECVGIDGGLGFGPVDWNANGLREGASRCGPIGENIKADTNNDGVCIFSGRNARVDSAPGGDDVIKDGDVITDGPNRVCQSEVTPGSDDLQVTKVGETPTQLQVLPSFDDWGNLEVSLQVFTAGRGDGPAEQEPHPDTVVESRRALSAATAPLVTLNHDGPSVAAPGDVLNYNLTIANAGRGPAVSAVLVEQQPDGSTTTADLGIVIAGSGLARVSTFTVPANACPGDLTAPGAFLAFKNFVGDDLSAADATPLQIVDVAAPAFDLVLSPNVLWPPNHQFVEVTATIASSDNCDASPDVTLVSITSNEPEAGLLGRGDRGPDVDGAAFGTDDRTFSLRAERDTGRGRTGRVYTVTYRVTDASGNTTERIATVTVPASNRQR